MADLQETLSRRERRSRVIAFAVGLVIVVGLILLLVQINDDGESVVDENNGQGVEQTADENTVDPFADSENENTGNGDSQTVTDSDEGDSATTSDSNATDASSDNQTNNGEVAATEDNLPATGPAETLSAIVGVSVLTSGIIYFNRSQRSLKYSQIKR